jgi:hypothetical protein
MTKVVTYKAGAFCQLKLDSGERVLISCAQTGIQIMKLALGGLIPSRTIFSWSISEVRLVAEIFADINSPNEHPLDAIKNKLINCKSIAEIELLCQSGKSGIVD